MVSTDCNARHLLVCFPEESSCHYGEEILGLSDRELQKVRGSKIAMVFQEPLTALDPLMRVGKQIAEPLKAHGMTSKQPINAKVEELLRLVTIADTELLKLSNSLCCYSDLAVVALQAALAAAQLFVRLEV